MPWVYLLAAGICEMIWPIGYKYTNGFEKRFWLIAGTVAFMVLSFKLMAVAIRGGIPIGTAYAVWTGIGAAGTAVVGITLFRESYHPLRLVCVALIILGVVGLKLLTPPEAAKGDATTSQPAAAETAAK